jgi:hypothetical protein
MRATGGMLPVALDAAVIATSRVRGPIAPTRSSMSSDVSSGRRWTMRTATPASRAASTHGVTLAS